MMALSGRDLGLALCHVLGIDHRKVRAIDIHCDVRDVAIVTVTRFVGVDDAQKIIEELDHYKLERM